jgi:purine-binding chemotaxis protein CheW
MSSPRTPAPDWEALLRQVGHNLAQLEHAGETDPERVLQILRERAVALATPGPRPADAPGASLEVLVFQVAGERYAFESGWVAQVLPMQPITMIPGVPSYIVGIFALAGEAVAVLDLRSLLGLPLAQLAEATALIVLRGAESEFAVLAEAIAGVQRYPADCLGQHLPGLAERAASYLQAVAPDRTAILDAGQMLADSTLVVHADR